MFLKFLQIFFVLSHHAQNVKKKKGTVVALEKKPTPKTKTSWWFQPLWKILVKMGIFPK